MLSPSGRLATSCLVDVVYTVKSGDWMAKIAEEYGTSVSAIWNHPGNAEHRAKRGSPDVLYPGDVLVVPSAVSLPPPPGVEPPTPPEVVPVPPPGVIPWPFPPPIGPPPSSLPTWSCPEGTCDCHPSDESDGRVPHTIVFYDPSGHRMPGARCMIYEFGRAITSPVTAANGAGELVIELGRHTSSLWVEWCPADLPTGAGMPYAKRYHVELQAHPVAGRLSNLGFAAGPRLSDNVSSYQLAQGLPVTGHPVDIADDLRAKHDGGALVPFAREPHVDADEPGTANEELASFLAKPPPFDTSLAAFGGVGNGEPQQAPQGGGGGLSKGGVVPNVGHLLLLVGLEPDAKPLEAGEVTLRLLPKGVPGLDPLELIHPSVSAITWGAIPSSYVLFGFANLPSGSYTALAHVGGIDDAHRGYALGRVDLESRVGLLNLVYLPVTRDRPILTVDDPLLELDVDAMQRRRKVLATIFVEFPQSADVATAPANMPPYQQGPYKPMLPGLDATNTCAPINVQTMQRAGARGHEFGFGQVPEVKNPAGITIGVKPRPAFVKFTDGLAPSVGDSFLLTDAKTGLSHHCGTVVRSSPVFGELWLTADGGQPDRTSPFMNEGGTWRRFYKAPHFPSGSREGAYVVPRLFHRGEDGRPFLGNRFIFPGITEPSGDVLFGWTDITHPTVRLESSYTQDITEEHFRSMQRLVRAIGPLVEDDIKRSKAEEVFGELEDVS